MKLIETIRVTANQKRRLFTIRKYTNGKMYAKYRTLQMSQEEFESNEMNTDNDWLQFLKTDEYEVI